MWSPCYAKKGFTYGTETGEYREVGYACMKTTDSGDIVRT